MSKEMETFVYKWTDIVTGMMYIGVHKGSQDDGYICSSKYMKEEYDKRPNDFFREILECGTDSHCREKEISLLREIDAAKNPMYYNKHNGGLHFCPPEVMAEETKQKISKAIKGKVRSAETRQKISLSKKGVSWGPMPEETKERIRASSSNRSAEFRKKISDTLRGKPKPPRTKEHNDKIGEKKRNTIWIHNDIISKMIPNNTNIPLGWKRGRGKWKGAKNG